MRRLLLAVGLLAAIPSPAAAQDRCAREGERAVARSDEASVVVRRERRTTTVTGCLAATGDRVRLLRTRDSFGYGIRVGPAAAAGTRVAVTLDAGDRGLHTVEVWVRDLSRPDASTRQIFLGERAPTALALAPRGPIAAIHAGEVRLLSGNRRRFDVAVPGALADLALTDGVLTWTHAGELRRAPLALPPACRVPAGVTPTVQSATAVVGQRRSGRSWTSVACRFDGGGWVDLGPPARLESLAPLVALAGWFVASMRVRQGQASIHVLDLATLAPAGPPVALRGADAPWALAPDGTVMASDGARGTVAQRLDGSRVVIDPSTSTSWIGVDDVTRQAIWTTSTDEASAPLPPPAPSSAACARRGETVLAAGPQAVLTSGGNGLRTTFVACDPTTGERHVVGEGFGDGFYVSHGLVEHAAANGPFLAWVEVNVVKGVGGETIVTHDVRTPEVVPDRRAFTDDHLVDIAVGPTGHVAVRTATTVAVLVADDLRVVDRAPPWRLSGLRVEADRVVWRHEGVERSAPLDPPAPPLRAVQRDGVVHVLDTATGAPVGPPVRRLGLRWQLAADGTVVVRRRARFVGHRRDGTVEDLGPAPSGEFDWTLDDQEGDVAWWGEGGLRGKVWLVPMPG